MLPGRRQVCTERSDMTATITPGHCKICHEPVNKIHEPENPVLRIDGIRFQYAEGSPFHKHPVYAIFRCDGCGQVIHDNWRAGDAATPPWDSLARATFEFRKIWPAGPDAPHEYAAAGFRALAKARGEMEAGSETV